MRRLFVRLSTLVALPLLVAGCGHSEFSGANVLVIGIDTLRRDRVGCYGYERPTTPRIDTLAVEGVVFEDAVAQAPWTLPSFASIFTGLIPSAHRAGEGTGWKRTPLAPHIPRLMTELKSRGWKTGCFVSNGFVGADVGLTEGCDEHYQWIDSRAAVEKATIFLRAYANRERFFAFVHLVDPHHPYEPRAEDAEPFLDPKYDGPIGKKFTQFPPPPNMTDADRQRISDLYDGEVHASDRLTGKLIDLLRELGVLEHTLVVVISDHGEELFDHGFIGHGHTMFDELLRVPFVIRFPGGRLRARVAPQVRAMDMFPTVLDALGLPIPPNLQGVSRMALIRGTTPPPGGEFAIAELPYNAPEKKVVRRPDFKIIYTPLENKTVAYDLSRDPHEMIDVSAKRASDVAGLRVVLESEALQRTEGFQIVARSGKVDHRLHLHLESAGGFTDVGVVGSEDGDSATLSADGHTIDATFVLPAAPTEVKFADDDALRFRLASDANFTLSADLEGDPNAFLNPFLGSPTVRLEGKQPWQIRFDDARLVVPFTPTLPAAREGSVRLAVYRVRRPAVSAATLDAKTRESLRALGYAE